jgi:hypothetical protein
LAGGLAIYLMVQGLLVNVPLWQRPMPPELDDSVTYILKTKLLQEGIFQDSPAVADLKRQLHEPTDNAAVVRQRALAGSRTFPFYHPLFSLLLLALHKLGLDLMTAFKVVWSLGPLIFGLAFAYFLTSLFGAGAAGLALTLLAFKVFPDTGLHYVVPSNLAMAIAVVVWGRLVSRQGQAPWTLALGSLGLVAIHPIGAIYALMSVALAFWLVENRGNFSAYLPMLLVVAAVALLFIFSVTTSIPYYPNLFRMPGGSFGLFAMCREAAISGVAVITSIVRTGGGLFGSPPFFCGAATLGLITLPVQARRSVIKILVLYLIALGGILFYRSSHPADVFLRLWIPLVAVLFGLVGRSLVLAGQLSFSAWQKFRQDTEETPYGGWQVLWPVVLAALLIGYVVEMSVKGGEIIAVTTEYMQASQPLDFSPRQPQLLLSLARPGDKVFYNSIIIMPYYLSQGACRLGAVYYHPAFQGDPSVSGWLSHPQLRFAAVYNPLVYHPSFAGLDENRWWPGYPDFYYSPLSKVKKTGPLAKDGQLAAADFSWLEVEVKTADFPKLLKIKIDNPGEASSLGLFPVAATRSGHEADKITAPVPAHWSGWVTLDLAAAQKVKRFRISLPPGAGYRLGGIIFGEDRLLWPWSQKASLTLKPRADSEAISVSFDPAAILPAPLNSRGVSILDDRGSAVLVQLE